MTYLVGLYWSPTVLFCVMIAVLIVKPEGLFGRYRKSVRCGIIRPSSAVRD